MVVGIATVGSEYRYGTLASSYLATPHRVQMLLGKAVALLIFGVIFGIASVAAGMLVSIPFVLGNGGAFLLDQPETWRSIILGVCSIALWTLIGMGIGILIKNMLVALVVGILLGFLVEPIVSVVFFLKRWDQLLNLMPSGATNAMLEITSPALFAGHHPSPWWIAALVLAAWCLLPALAGVLSAARRDVA
jgi:ABC-type transport system involved in multi-copper enzyme maturation permease subunit